MIFDPFVIAIFAAGLYMAWNIGANDLANSMADVVGSKSLTVKQVIITASIFTFLGAVLFGGRVTKTIGRGIVPIHLIDPNLLVLGALAALIAAGIWITIATFLGLPVSTTHSIVGGMLGFGLVAVGTGTIEMGDIAWVVLLKVMASWVISPICGMCLAFLVFTLIRRLLIERVKDLLKLERNFKYLNICSSCYQAFAWGSNDIANAVGPISVVLGTMGYGAELPVWVLALGAVGILIGLSTWGYKVILTTGEMITELVPTRGFSADIGGATTVFICSYLGMPVSTTHTIVGAVIGVGLARGLNAVDLRIIRRIVFSWLVTVPIVTVIAAMIYLGLMGI